MTDERDDTIDAGVERRLSSAFDAEVRLARHDVAVRPLRLAPRSASTRAGVAVLVVVLVVTGGLVFQALGLVPGLPVGFWAQSSPAPSAASAEPSVLPRRLGGQDVLGVEEALAVLAARTDDRPVLVGGWLETFENVAEYCTDHPLTGCKDRLTPTSDTIAPALWLSLDAWRGSLSGYVVLQVHNHDDRAAQCEVGERRICQEAVVLDVTRWSRPREITDPTPFIPASPRPTSEPDAIPGQLFGQPVLRPADAIRWLAGHEPGTTVLVGGIMERLVIDCVAPCPVIGSVLDVDDPSSKLDWRLEVPWEPGVGRVVVRLTGGTPARLDAVVWRDSGSLPDTAPRFVDGSPVLTVSEAIVRGESALDATPFAVGGWYRHALRSCPAPGPGDLPASPIVPSCWRTTELHDVARWPDANQRLPSVDLVIPDGVAQRFGTGPVVLRVHTHDRGANECPFEHRLTCERQLVVEDAVWTAPDDAAAPLPSGSVAP